MTNQGLDLLLVHPGGREKVYQGLSKDLAAFEPPLWCRLIAGYVRDRGWSVAILDSQAEGIGSQAIGARVRDLSPRLSCVVVTGHQPSASTQSMVGARDACEAIRDAAPDVPILMLGGHPSALAEQTLRDEPVDWVCKGEGPITVVQLLNAISGEKPDLATVEGLVWRDGERVQVNPAAPLIKDMDADLHGFVWDLLPMDRYRAHNWQCFGDLDSRRPYASIYTSLGCPYKCSFCCINAPFDGNAYRMRSPEAVVAEVDYLYRTHNIRTFKIIDEMFILNDRHVNSICRGLAAKPYANQLNMWAYARVDTVKEEQLELLRSAGIRWLALGIESGSSHVRDGASKALKENDILKVVRQIQNAGINVIGNYIFGLPDDNHETMQETLDLAQSLNCEFANFYSTMAYPGSALYRDALQNGWEVPVNWSEFSQHSYDCNPLPTGKISAAEVLRFRDEAFHSYFESPRYLDMVTERFGLETRQHIEEMSKHHLRRKLLEDNQ